MQSNVTERRVTITGKDAITVGALVKAVAFGGALIPNILFRYSKLFMNESLKHEFFPSIPDTITNAYPYQFFYQVNIAIWSFVNLINTVLLFVTIKSKSPNTAKHLTFIQVLRHISLICFSCIPTKDDIKSSTNFFVIYTLSTLSWMYLYQCRITSRNISLNRTRKIMRDSYATLMTLSAICYYKHQVEHSVGWYSAGALLQWVMVSVDTYFDYLTSNEVRDVKLQMDLDNHKSGHLV